MTELGLHGSNQAFGVVEDAGDGGMRVWVPQDVHPEGGVVLRVNLGEEILQLPATLRWRAASERGGTVVGFGFVGGGRERQRLRALIG